MSATAWAWPRRPRGRTPRSSSRPACTSWPRPPRSCRPDKTVLIPDLRAGCSLAASITGADVRLIKQRYPGLPVVTYVNTTADVKAETDICCTSANAVQVVEWAAQRMGRRPRHPDPRRVPGPQRRAPDRRRHHRLEGPLRGARALHRRRHRRDARGLSRRRDPGPPGMPRPTCWRPRDFAGSTAAMTDYVDQPQAEAGGADHRMLDGRQRRRRRARAPSSSALQPVPAHEADHAGEHLRDCLLHDAVRGDGRPRRSPSAPALAVQRMIDLPPPAIPARYDLVKARHHVDVELI